MLYTGGPDVGRLSLGSSQCVRQCTVECNSQAGGRIALLQAGTNGQPRCPQSGLGVGQAGDLAGGVVAVETT